MAGSYGKTAPDFNVAARRAGGLARVLFGPPPCAAPAGVQYRVNFMWADFSGEDVGTADDNEGIAFTTTIRLAF